MAEKVKLEKSVCVKAAVDTASRWMENELNEGKFRKEEHEQNNI